MIIGKFKKLFEASEDELNSMDVDMPDMEDGEGPEETEQDQEMDLFDRMATFITGLDKTLLPEDTQVEFDAIVTAIADAEKEDDELDADAEGEDLGGEDEDETMDDDE